MKRYRVSTHLERRNELSDDIIVEAYYDKDTFRCHRYLIKEGQVIKGTLYVSKDTENIPKEVVVQLKIKEA